MKIHSIKCEAVEVRTESGICPGLARTRKGESCIIDGRTPEKTGMCSNAFCAVSNAVFIMMAMDEMPGEKDGFKELICPHGKVTFRISRSAIPKKEPFDENQDIKLTRQGAAESRIYP